MLGPWSNIFTSISIVANNLNYSRFFIKDITRQHGSGREIAFSRTYAQIYFLCAFIASQLLTQPAFLLGRKEMRSARTTGLVSYISSLLHGMFILCLLISTWQ